MSLLKLLGLREDQLEGVNTDKVKVDAIHRIVSLLETLPEDRAYYLATFAYILGRVAHADSKISSREIEKMQEIVCLLGHLPQEQAMLVVEIAIKQVQLFGSTENISVSKQFKKMTTPEQREELLDCVFAVSAADESITVVEEGQARQISMELGMTHDEFIDARAAFLEHIEAIKGFQKYL